MKIVLDNTLKAELKDLIFNTLNFCGNTYLATIDFCHENRLEMSEDVENFRYQTIEDFHNTTILRREHDNTST